MAPNTTGRAIASSASILPRVVTIDFIGVSFQFQRK